MQEFLLVFRRDFKSKEAQPTPENLKIHLEHWKAWFADLSKQGIISRKLPHWDGDGRVLSKDKKSTNGPFVEIKESIGGVTIINAADYGEAEKIASGCPIFELGGSVEIRMGKYHSE